mgnify:CR=1 FL=1
MSFVLSKRQQWMAQQVVKGFALDAATVEKCFRDNKKRLDAFLNNDASAPPKIFFFYQKRQQAKPELFVSVSTFLLLFPVCVFPCLYLAKLPTSTVSSAPSKSHLLPLPHPVCCTCSFFLFFALSQTAAARS